MTSHHETCPKFLSPDAVLCTCGKREETFTCKGCDKPMEGTGTQFHRCCSSSCARDVYT